MISLLAEKFTSQKNELRSCGMSAEFKSTGGSIALILFGIAAFFVGTKWLLILVPAALLVWYGAMPILRSGRN
jgi:hypothetical protein